MIARVTRYQVASGKIDEDIKAFKDGVIPAVKLQKGYLSSYLLTDRKTGKCISLAFWESEEDVIADEKSGQYQRRVDIGKDHFIDPPVRELYEVAIQD